MGLFFVDGGEYDEEEIYPAAMSKMPKDELPNREQLLKDIENLELRAQDLVKKVGSVDAEPNVLEAAENFVTCGRSLKQAYSDQKTTDQDLAKSIEEVDISLGQFEEFLAAQLMKMSLNERKGSRLILDETRDVFVEDSDGEDTDSFGFTIEEKS